MKFEFPDMELPDSKKDEEWHKQYLRAVMAISSLGSPSRIEMAKNFEYLKGNIDPEADYNHLVLSINGEPLPPDMVSFNSIPRFVNQLIGEIDNRGTDINVKALSKSAISRKRDEQLTLEVMSALAPIADIEEQEYGIQLMPSDIPRTDADLKYSISKVKETGERVYDRILDDLIRRNRWAQIREEAFKDAVVGGACFAEVYLEDGFVKISLEDARTVVWDRNCDPWLNGAQFIGKAKYIPLHEAKTRFRLTDEDIEQIKKDSSGSFMWFGEDDKYDVLKTFGGHMYVLYTQVYFYDTKKKVGIERENQEGVSLYFIEDEEVDPALPRSKATSVLKEREKAKKLTPIHYRIVRQCAMLGGTKCVAYGEVENQVRTTDDWHYTQFPIVGFLPGWKYNSNKSVVSELVPLQKLKNEALHKLRQNIQRDKGMQMLYDQAQMPEDLMFEDLDYLGQVLGIVPMNSVGPGIPSNFNQFRNLDRTVSPNVVSTYWQIAKLADQEMEIITGVTPARQGIISTPSIAVGVNEASKAQSYIQTVSLFFGFDEFTEMLYTTALGMAKIAVTNMPGKYEHIVGEDGMQFLMSDTGYNLDDYGAYVTTSSLSIEDKEVLRNATINAMTNRNVDYYDGVMMLIEDNPDEALYQLRESLNRKKEEMQVQMQQQMAAQQQMVAQQSQEKMAIESAKLQQRQQSDMIDAQTRLQVADMQSKTTMAKEMARGAQNALSMRAKMLNERIKMANRV